MNWHLRHSVYFVPFNWIKQELNPVMMTRNSSQTPVKGNSPSRSQQLPAQLMTGGIHAIRCGWVTYSKLWNNEFIYYVDFDIGYCNSRWTDRHLAKRRFNSKMTFSFKRTSWNRKERRDVVRYWVFPCISKGLSTERMQYLHSYLLCKVHVNKASKSSLIENFFSRVVQHVNYCMNLMNGKAQLCYDNFPKDSFGIWPCCS